MLNKEDTMIEYIEWIRVNPAGNITCLVTTKVARELYMEVANQLLSLPGQDFEQVGFIIDDKTMEMAGLEFCGNASRAFALWSAKKLGLQGQHNVFVSVSGIEKPLEVFVDTQSNFTRAFMPLPEKIELISEGTIMACPQMLKVDLGGIMHFVVLDLPYSDSIFHLIKDFGMSHFQPPALGVMFVDSGTFNMVPIVYVKEVDTIYHEGSCGSGTLAALISLEEKLGLGEEVFHCNLTQPRGEIGGTLYKNGNIIEKITIEGHVEIGEIEKLVVRDFMGSQEEEDE
jgi:diaminopimelate epimerase